MIAVDTNILVYAHRKDSPHHRPAHQILQELAEGAAAWAIPWPCIHEFLAVVTHARIYDPPTPPAAALEQIEAWMESPTLALISEASEYWADLRAVVIAGRATGPRIHDARIAALCRQHGVRELWTADRDFSRYPDLRTLNPLG